MNVPSFAVTHLAEVTFLWRWHTFIITVRWRRRRWVVITATGIPRGRVLRKWWGSTWRPPPIRAVALAVQSFPAACPLLLAHLLPLHGFSQEAVVIIISPAPGAAASPAILLKVHQIVTAAAASPWEATVGPSVSSPTSIGGVVAAPAVIKVAIVAAAGTTAPPIIRAKETRKRKIEIEGKQEHTGTVSVSRLTIVSLLCHELKFKQQLRFSWNLWSPLPPSVLKWSHPGYERCHLALQRPTFCHVWLNQVCGAHRLSCANVLPTYLWQWTCAHFDCVISLKQQTHRNYNHVVTV